MRLPQQRNGDGGTRTHLGPHGGGRHRGWDGYQASQPLPCPSRGSWSPGVGGRSKTDFSPPHTPPPTPSPPSQPPPPCTHHAPTPPHIPVACSDHVHSQHIAPYPLPWRKYLPPSHTHGLYHFHGLVNVQCTAYNKNPNNNTREGAHASKEKNNNRHTHEAHQRALHGNEGARDHSPAVWAAARVNKE
jgi:hypothetical protein